MHFGPSNVASSRIEPNKSSISGLGIEIDAAIANNSLGMM
jgi:hypothetical protein